MKTRLFMPSDMAILLTIINPTWAHSAISIPTVGNTGNLPISLFNGRVTHTHTYQSL